MRVTSFFKKLADLSGQSISVGDPKSKTGIHYVEIYSKSGKLYSAYRGSYFSPLVNPEKIIFVKEKHQTMKAADLLCDEDISYKLKQLVIFNIDLF